MNRSNILYVALATMTLATSCAQDELQSSQAAQSEISFNASMGLRTRATETKTADLKNFYVSSFVSEKANYMTDVKYTYNTSSTPNWQSPTGETYFWPVSETLNFYAYAYGPNAATAITTVSQGVTIGTGSDNQKITNFKPIVGNESEGSRKDAESQEDLIYACVTGTKTGNEQNGVSLTFKHALSEISVKALNSNTAYQIKVTGVKLGNIISQNTFTFPTATAEATGKGTWGTSSATNTYETDFTGDNAVTLTSDAAFVDNEKPFMLIPQSCTKKDKYIDGHYIALKVTIIQKGTDGKYDGQVIHDGWAFVGINTTWEQGKHYTYILNFSEGAGQDSNGNQIISGSPINIANVTVTPISDETEIKDTNMSGVEPQG